MIGSVSGRTDALAAAPAGSSRRDVYIRSSWNCTNVPVLARPTSPVSLSREKFLNRSLTLSVTPAASSARPAHTLPCLHCVVTGGERYVVSCVNWTGLHPHPRQRPTPRGATSCASRARRRQRPRRRRRPCRHHHGGTPDRSRAISSGLRARRGFPPARERRAASRRRRRL